MLFYFICLCPWEPSYWIAKKQSKSLNSHQSYWQQINDTETEVSQETQFQINLSPKYHQLSWCPHTIRRKLYRNFNFHQSFPWYQLNSKDNDHFDTNKHFWGFIHLQMWKTKPADMFEKRHKEWSVEKVLWSVML